MYLGNSLNYFPNFKNPYYLYTVQKAIINNMKYTEFDAPIFWKRLVEGFSC